MNEKFFERKIRVPQKNEKEQKSESKSAISPEATEDLRKKLEELTEKYKKDERFKEILQELEKIAREQGIEGILIKADAHIGWGGYKVYRVSRVRERNFKVAKYDKNKVCIGEDILENIRNLFRIDKEFARRGYEGIFSHEKEESEGQLGEREFLEFEEFLKEAKNYDEVVKKISELKSKYDEKREMQAELQRIAKTYKNLDFKQEEDLKKFIEGEARTYVTTKFSFKGVRRLKNIKYMAEIMKLVKIYNFIKPNLQKLIIKRMEEMRKELLKKSKGLKNLK